LTSRTRDLFSPLQYSGASLDILPTCIKRSYIGEQALATSHSYLISARTSKYYYKKRQEARLYLPCVAAILLPIGMLIYAWTARPEIPWIAPAIGLTVFMSGAFVIFMVGFLYLADCYGTYASSAIAGMSLCRNFAVAAFPLFTMQMFARLTYRWGLTLFACIAAALVPVPWVLFFYGSRIRAQSKVSQSIQDDEELRERVGK